MFVVAGASGNTGKVVVETLRARGAPVRVIARDARGADEARKEGLEAAVAGLDDAAALTEALRGAEGAYLLLPPNYASTSVRADNRERAEVIARAVDASGVKHVVFLSSIGAQHDGGTGPIASLHDGEAALRKTKADVTFLRCAYFMENWGQSLYALGQGALPTFLLADQAMPMVATRDIGATAARLLLEGGHGKRVVQLSGPRDLSPRDVAEALGRVVGKPVTVQQGPEEAMPGALQGAGMNAEWARLFTEMTHAANVGELTWEPGPARAQGSTDVEAVLRALVAGAPR